MAKQGKPPHNPLGGDPGRTALIVAIVVVLVIAALAGCCGAR